MPDEDDNMNMGDGAAATPAAEDTDLEEKEGGEEVAEGEQEVV